MYSFRISKYNPKFRNEDGVYTEDEWTSMADIGKTYNYTSLTQDEYERTEDNYINCIKELLREANISELQLMELENANNYKTPFPLQNKLIYTVDTILQISRLVLREAFWCKLENASANFLHFGYDYYIYVGLDLTPDKVTTITAKYDLFAEQISKSPYSA